MNFSDYIGRVGGNDFNRTNMFSVAFSCGPGSRAVTSFDSLSTNVVAAAGGAGSLIGGVLDLSYKYGKNLASQKINSWANGNDGRRVFGALNTKFVQSMLGDMLVGQEVLNMFSDTAIIDCMVEGFQLPDIDLGHKYAQDPFGKIHDFGKWNPGYLTVTFRQMPNSKVLQGWLDYRNLVINQQSNARMWPDDIELKISINQYDRNHIPEVVHQFDGCLPVGVSLPEFSYENNNEIVKYTVRFAMRSYYVGSLGDQARKDFIEDLGGLVGGKIGSIIAPGVNAITSPITSKISSGLTGMSSTIGQSIGDMFKF